MTATPETRSFQAHTRKLLDLMIHSIYSHKEIFLRELVSNASDAIDKVRFEALTHPELASGAHKITLVADTAARTLTVTDTGIGMSYDEVVEHIGTIAKSGSEDFTERLKTAAATSADVATPELIGQFGVGFYSAFMVADRVELITQKHGESEAIRWQSIGDGSYTIERLPPRDRGTAITLHLRPHEVESGQEEDSDTSAALAGDTSPKNDQDYTDSWVLRQIIKKYSDFIAYPIVMDVEKYEVERDENGAPVKGAETKKLVVQETLNSQKPLWTRQPSSVSKEEYAEFYRHLTKDWSEPAETLHLHVEGAQEWSALVYVPGKAPFDLFSRAPRQGLSLYIKRVFIADDVDTIVPAHLRFLRGLVDSSDLPLNVSREVVQQDRLISSMRKHLTNKVYAYLKDLLARDRERYETFWQTFGACLKEGFHYEPGHRDKLADLMLVRTTTQEGWSTLAEVKERMKEGQKALYFLTGDNADVLAQAPQLEGFRKRGVEVMLLGEAVDEVVVGVLDAWQETPLQSAAREDLEGLGEESAEAKDATETATKSANERYKPLLDKMRSLLEGDIADVKLSTRLTDSAVCLVTAEGGMSGHLERMLQAMGQAMPPQKRVLEVNPDHALIVALRDMVEQSPADDTMLGEYVEMLVDQALLAEGAPLKNPARFARRIADAMARAASHPPKSAPAAM